MSKITLFERIKWGCDICPHEIDILEYRYSGFHIDQTTGERIHSLREFVEMKKCNWEWYCYEWGLNPTDENGNW